MMNLARPHVHRLALIVAGLNLVACSSNDTGVGCPEGWILDSRGICIIRGGADTGDRDTAGRDVPEGDAPADTGTDPRDEDTAPVTCTPEDKVCLDAETAAECNATGDGWIEAHCTEDQVCDDGVCGPRPAGCTPGEVLGCETGTARRVCGDDGLPGAVACPAATPNCVDGGCTDQICVPGRRRCEGNDIVECSDDGRAEDVVQICEFGCATGRCADPCAGESKDYLGCTFWAADLDNYAGNGGQDADYGITISNGTTREVNIEITRGDGTPERELTIAPGSLETVVVGPLNVDDTNLTYNTFQVASDAPVTVHQFNPLNNVGVFSNDASLLLPATSLSSEYVVAGWPSTDGSSLKAFVAIIAVGEGTTEVRVTSPVATLAGGSVPALAPGVERAFSIEQGQVLSFATADLSPVGFTGMTIDASQPIAVFSGAECANVPVGAQYCDHIEEQLFPVETWGMEFVGAKFRARGDEPDIWRVVASENGTDIRTTPSIPIIDGRTLGRGEYVEFVTDTDFVLTADEPVSLAQFMVGSAYPGFEAGCGQNGFDERTWGCAIPRSDTCGGDTAIGDPAFLIDVPTAQFREDYIVLTPSQYQEDYFTIIARPGTTVRIDGVEVTAARVNVGTWQVIRVPATDGVHSVNADAPIGLYAYGYDCDVSYAYPGGLNLEAL